jgi:hypothetical protein
MHRRDSDVLMDSNLAFSARQLKYEAGSRRLCVFTGKIGLLGRAVTLAKTLLRPCAASPRWLSSRCEKTESHRRQCRRA